MRILSIRGSNLASLAEPFHLDLTAEPLAGTGLFAITGDTGAGKSTILDSLCLALYGSFPRASDRRNEEVRDTSGDTLQASDPRNILRRGAASATAEVEFVGGDGIEYRATWAVRRARSKSGGRLQNVERKLERRDGTGVVATGARDVLDAVVQRSGFTFDEFRRAVLLAQGEFDALLLADEARRAELLEKITGTAIYSRISMRVFQETQSRQQAIDELARRREAIGVKDDAAREALATEREGLTTELARVEGERTRIVAELALAEDIARVRASLVAAQERLAQARAAWETSTAERSRAAEIEGVQALRATHRAVVEQRRKQATAAEAEQAAARVAGAAQAGLAQAEGLYEAQQRAASAASAEVARLEPIWRQAEAFDHKITMAGAEHDKALATAADAQEAQRSAAATIERLDERRRAAEMRLAGAEKVLKERMAHAVLVERRDLLAQLLDRQLALARRGTDVSRELASTSGKEEAIRRRLGDGQQRLDDADRERKDVALRLTERRKALQAIDRPGLDARDEVLRAIILEIAPAREAVRRRDEARAAATRAAQDIEAETGRQSVAAVTARQVDTAYAAAAAARDEAGRMADLAEATLSRQAEHLRSTLVDGHPCPVCGGSEHPFAHDSGRADALAAGLRRNRSARERELAEAADAVKRAGSALATSEARLTQLTRNRAVAETSLIEAIGDLRQHLPRLGEQLRLAGATRAAGDAECVEREEILALERWATSERSALAEPRRQASALAKDCEQLQERVEKASRAIETEQAARDEDAKSLGGLRARLGELKGVSDEINGQLTRTLGELEPFLVCAGLTASDLARDGGPARRRLERMAADYASARTACDLAEQELAAIAAEITQAAPVKAAAEKTAADTALALAERRRQLDELRDERAKILGGEATDSHRAGLLARLKSTGEAHEAARTAVGDARQRLAALVAALAAAREKLEASIADLAAAESAWSSGLGERALEAERAIALLSVPDEQRQAAAERIESLRNALQSAETTLRMREHDLAERLAGADEPDPEAIAELASLVGEHNARRDALSQRQAVIGADLARDEEARSRAMDVETEIERRRRDLAVWRDVDEAIGQKDGAKFRRFAQGVTLGQLVALANVQLAALSPRYRLRRGELSDLAFDVIDRDMGEEARAPRSLSGGERFLVSLALALALSGLEGRQSFVDTLFIDEGFGALDREALDTAIDVLESLQGRGRKVGVITHVPAMMERIAVQVRVVKRGGGRSVVRVSAPDVAASAGGLIAAT